MLINVIIPTYNGEKTIKRAIESVLNQNGNWNIEILVCDDCSTDRTLEIAESYPNVKVFVNPYHTGGPNKGRNIGIKNATGDYIAFLDQDDEWLPNKLEKQFMEIESGAELVTSRSLVKVG